MLRRNLSPKERSDVLLSLGMTYRSSQAFERSRESLQQAIDLAGGIDTQAGGAAALQMAWTHQIAGDPAAARRWFERTAASTDAFPHLRLEAQWNVLEMAADAGEQVRDGLASLLRALRRPGPGEAHRRRLQGPPGSSAGRDRSRGRT